MPATRRRTIVLPDGSQVVDRPHREAYRVSARSRLPYLMLDRWPQTRQLAFPAVKPGMQWAGAFAPNQDTAEQAALGLALDMFDWKSGLTLLEVGDGLMAPGTRVPAPGGGDWLVLAQVPWRPEGVLGVPSDEQIEAVVHLPSGSVVYSRSPFPGAYQRVAVVVRVDRGSVWAVQWNDFPVWSLPGGHIEDGEGILKSAGRELLEETAITANFVAYRGQWHTARATTWVLQAEFVSRDESRQLDPAEIAAAMPMSINDLFMPDRIFVKKHWDRICDLKDLR